MKTLNLKNIFLILTFASACFGVIFTLLVALSKTDLPYDKPTVFVNIFSYFTIQSNILVALVAGSWLFKINLFGRFKKAFELGALMNITLTFIIVRLILAALQNLTGADLWADNFVHIITPVLFVFYWLLFHEKTTTNYKNVLGWTLVYAPLYVAYTLLRGPIVEPDWYPYPFINATELSYQQIFINVAGIIFIFLIIGAVFVVINNTMSKGKK